MSTPRVFDFNDHLRASDDVPIRSIVHESPDATVVAWTVGCKQRVAPHVHPYGQDTWYVIAGEGDYQLDSAGATQRICAGQVVVAATGEVHGIVNTGGEALVFISVVCPLEAGYRALPESRQSSAPFVSSSWVA